MFRGAMLFLLLLLSVQYVQPSAVCTDEICHFDWHIRWDRTMVYRTGQSAYDVGLNATDNGLYTLPNSYTEVRPFDSNVGIRVSAINVNTGDGYPRNIITINGLFPGPTIEVLEHAQVVVRVTNHLFSEDTTIHFHGLRQLNNTINDGVSHLSQCPITPGQTFTYRFHAYPSGTHWYHSHLKGHRLDGLHGMFIVHKTFPSLHSFPMIVTDWRHVTSQTLLITAPYFYEYAGTGEFDDLHGLVIDPYDNNSDLYDLSILLNGRGRTDSRMLPLSVFDVNQGEVYRFRMVHAGSTPRMKVAIDGHQLRVVGTDGTEIDPLPVDFIFISPGERIDFLLEANQPSSIYWIRSWILMFNEKVAHKGKVGILKYNGFENAEDPSTNMLSCSPERPCRAYNCQPHSIDHLGINCYDIQMMHNVQDSRTYLYELDKQEGYLEHFLNFDFANGPTVNGIKFFEPQGHVGQTGLTYIPCDRDTCAIGRVCECTQVIELPYNRSIQLVMSNIGFVTTAHHVIHLHGHEFAVLKQGYAQQGDTLDDLDVVCADALCHTANWRGEPPEIEIDKPVIKDTISIPALGYVVIRFRSDNPGMWFLHCHSELHAAEGMAIVLMTSGPDSAWTPDSIPVCYRNYGQSRVNQVAALSGALDLSSLPGAAGEDDMTLEQETSQVLYKLADEDSPVILVPPAILVTLVLFAAIGGAFIMLLTQNFFGKKPQSEPRYPPLLSDY